MKVRHMNASPSLQFDLMRGTDLVGSRLTPPGFYYKTFIRPRRLWPLYEKVLRNAAGLGKLPKKQADREWHTEYRRRRADVLVIGGGVAGMAARRAATGGRRGAGGRWPRAGWGGARRRFRGRRKRAGREGF
jgi:sarcosine oxidase subunit alpha